MKWRTPKQTKQGDRRTVRYFALFPTRLDDGWTIMWRWYWAEEEWYDQNGDRYWITLETWIDWIEK